MDRIVRRALVARQLHSQLAHVLQPAPRARLASQGFAHFVPLVFFKIPLARQLAKDARLDDLGHNQARRNVNPVLQESNRKRLRHWVVTFVLKANTQTNQAIPSVKLVLKHLSQS